MEGGERPGRCVLYSESTGYRAVVPARSQSVRKEEEQVSFTRERRSGVQLRCVAACLDGEQGTVRSRYRSSSVRRAAVDDNDARRRARLLTKKAQGFVEAGLFVHVGMITESCSGIREESSASPRR